MVTDSPSLTRSMLACIVAGMNANLPSQRKIQNYYLAIAAGCGLFVVLTFIAMLTYAGGTYDNHAAPGYSFTHNFLSNLGMLTAVSGKPNWISAILFILALAAAGAGLVIFFIIFPRLFTESHLQQVLGVIGSILGVLAGVNFIGIAFAPADIARPIHIQFVMWAFRLFPLAVLFYIPVLFIDKHYPRAYAWVFVVFCFMLIGYYLLMTNGPSFSSPEGLVIQAVGQKVIAYASIVSIGVQALGAYRYLAKAASSEHSALSPEH